MLVDAAKYGDVEIPVFCYEPKLGQPVGACRMCLVEIEGIPKLQTGCSTPVKDGMVVHTQTQRVHDAQRAVVEFLLINHPLDCPVCDKGGECPLQDITYGWGPGTSRFIEPKRHFKKPLELSPLIAIDRERCILCYRCVRYSQEVSEDYQLVLVERGAASFVGTFDGHPYVAPFSGNIIELCPVGALTSRAYRFRARPWDIEGAGTVCTLCPAQCNVELTVRDERVLRVLGRDNPEVDDGWLCDKGRFAYQYTHAEERIVEPLVREGTELMPASWEKAIAARRRRAEEGGRPRRPRWPAATTTNEEAFLLQRPAARLPRLQPPERPARRRGAAGRAARARTTPTLQAIGAGPRVRPHRAAARLRPDRRRADPGPAAAQGHPPARHEARRGRRAADRARSQRRRRSCATRPARGEAFLVALDAALAGDDGNLGGAASAAGTQRRRGQATSWRRCAAAGEEVVIVYGERLLRGQAGRALLNIATRLGLRDIAGAGAARAARPRPTAAACARPASPPATAPATRRVADARARRRAASPRGWRTASCTRVWLHHADPLRTHPDRALWDRALHTAQTVIVVDSRADGHDPRARRRRLPRRGLRREGGHARAPGRPRAAAAPGDRPRPRRRDARHGVRPLWQVIAEVSARARPRPGRRADRRRRLQAAVRGRAVLRGADARRDRRARRALAGARRRRPRPPGSWRRSTCPPRAPAAARRRAAARHVPLAVGVQGGRGLARAALPAPAARWSSSRRSTPTRSASARATASRSARTAPVCAAAVRLRAAIPSGTVFLAEGTTRGHGERAHRALVEVAARRPSGARAVRRRRAGRRRASRAARRCRHPRRCRSRRGR